MRGDNLQDMCRDGYRDNRNSCQPRSCAYFLQISPKVLSELHRKEDKRSFEQNFKERISPPSGMVWRSSLGPSCFHGSVGNGWDVVSKYIETQDVHHAKNDSYMPRT